MKKLIVLFFVALIPLETLAGITMSNVLEFVFNKEEIGTLEQAKLSLSEDGSAWGLKFKQGNTKDDKEIWRVGIYFEGNFKLLEQQFLIPSNVKHKESCLTGPILSPNGKRWGLIYQERSNGGDCNTPQKDSSYVWINLEKFGPFDHAEQLKFSANDNFSFIGQGYQDKTKQLYSRIIRNIINKDTQPIDAFITSSGLPKIVYAPDGTHWLLGACTARGVCYVQEKGKKRAKGPFLSISNIAYWGDWDKADNRAWGISYFKDNSNSEKIFINTEGILPLPEQITVLKFAYSQHQAKAWGLIYQDPLDQNNLYMKAEWPDEAPVYSELDTLSFAPNGDFLAFSYRETKRENWQIDIYSLKNGQLKKHFTANPCGEVECDFKSIEDLIISDDPEQFWGYVAKDSNQKQYLVMYKHKSHFQTLGPFKDIQGFYITPKGYSYGMRYTKSDKNEIGYYIYDRYAKLAKYEGMSWGSDLLFSGDQNKPLWGFVYKGRENHNEKTSQYYVMINGNKIKSREDKESGFNHASIALLKKDSKKVFSLVYLDKVTVQNKTIYRVRVNEIKQPYIPVSLKQAWTTSHTPNVGYKKVLQIGHENFCKGSSEPDIERVCLQGITSSTKISALRLFFKRLGLERSKTDLEIHQCDGKPLKCRKPIINASKLIEFLEEKEGITNYSVNKSNFWLDIPVRGLPIQISYEVKGDFELLGHSRLEYPFGYEITQIEYIPTDFNQPRVK